MWARAKQKVCSASAIPQTRRYPRTVRRGRPPHPDVLTPREWEVLAFVREGMTNEQIASRLGISESGVRFHVSEILSKLGVSGREEAAAWSSESKRWSIIPAFLSLHAGKTSTLLFVGLKGAAALGFIALAGIAVALSDNALSQLPDSSAGARPTPDPLEWCRPQCVTVVPQRFTTLQEAASLASFEPRLPSWVPPGFEPYLVEYARAPLGSVGDKETHNDWITVYFRNPSGGMLVVAQGFPASPVVVALPGVEGDLNDRAPQASKGTVKAGEKLAYWLRGDPWSPRDRDLLDQVKAGKVPIPDLQAGGLVLAWEVGRFGAGYAVSPDRTEVQYGSPMSYGLMSDVLSLDELVKIAASVSFD